MGELLEVTNLTVQYGAGRGTYTALDRVTLEVRQGEVVGILGESGSGKTTLGLAILQLLPATVRSVSGSIRFCGRELHGLGEKELQPLRGSEISMIFQEPDLALNPFIRALDQVEEVIRAHRRWDRTKRREQAHRVLAEVGLDEDPRLLTAYPQQLSGGERQRLVIAQALACRPSLLIADEPTASLDSIRQAEWLALIKDLRYRLGLAIVLITHNPAILEGLADRVLVLYGGRVIEDGPLEQIIRGPRHPWTRALLRSIPPAPDSKRVKKRLPAMVESRSFGNAGCVIEPPCGWNDRE